MKQKTFIVLLATTISVGSVGSGHAFDRGNCWVERTGKMSKFGLLCYPEGSENADFIWLKRRDAGAMLEIKDSSLRNPWGGRHSVPNKLHRQFVKKPVKFIKRLFK